MVCSRCHEVHLQKTYHLDLDSEGCTIVSPVVFERLREIGMAGFEVLNEVKNPPPITLNIPGRIENKFKVFEMSSSGERNGKA